MIAVLSSMIHPKTAVLGRAGGGDNNIILIDSFGNEPKKEDRKNYILKKRGKTVFK